MPWLCEGRQEALPPQKWPQRINSTGTPGNLPSKPPGGTGWKEALALLSNVFKSRAVKSRPPNVHIMWETVSGRKRKEGELRNWKRVTIQTQDCSRWKLHSAMFCSLRKRESPSQIQIETHRAIKSGKRQTQRGGGSQREGL